MDLGIVAHVHRKIGAEVEEIDAGGVRVGLGQRPQLGGKGDEAVAAKEVAKLQREIETREQVIGELTIANRILKKLSGPSL